MTKLVVLPLLFITLVSCGQIHKSDKQRVNAAPNTMNTSIVAVLPYFPTQNGIFFGGKPANLTQDDLTTIKKILTECVTIYNSEQEKRFNEMKKQHLEYKLDKKHFIVDLTSYKRQYIAVMNKNTEKEVWVNCFCNTWDKNWRKEIIRVMDGGNCYFNLKINLTTRKYYDFRVNGEA